jgi:putative sensor histidine kinase
MMSEVTSGVFKQSHSQLILNRSLSGAVGMVCDVRLGILLACEIALLTAEANFFDILQILLTMAMSWLPLHLFSKFPQALVNGFYFPLSDLALSVILIFSLRENYYGIQHLLFAYILTSALLEGLLVNLSYKVIWSSAVIVALALSRSQSQTLATSLTVFVVLSLGVVFAIVLGDRLRSQFEDIDRLTEETMSIRAEERALAERLVIARDLHDSLAKSVHGIRMLAETLTADLEETQHQDSTLSRTLFESADEASREARLILDGLRVTNHEQSSLLDWLIDQVYRWGARTGVEVVCSQTGGNSDHQPFSSEVVWHIQRILGEILTNIEKHAHATTVFVDLSVDSTSLTLEIRDNGIGLSSGCVHTPAEGHYGIEGMFERAHILNATLTIDGHSAAGGVHTVLTVPLDSLDSVEGAA